MGDAFSLPDGRYVAARRERERFLARYQRFLNEAREISLSVLVWGPGPTYTSPVAQKRRDIRDELIDQGHYAMFSEDLPDFPGHFSTKAKEFAQARAAHVILILIEDAPGALAETHDFSGDPNISPKVFVLAPKKYRAGYSGQGALRDLSDCGGVYWYDDEEVGRCNVLTRAVRRVEAMRNMRFCARKKKS
jgi:hypothetical protein